MKTLKIIALLAVSVLMIGLVACPSSKPADVRGPAALNPPPPPPPPENITLTEGIPEGWPDSIPIMEGLNVIGGGIGDEGASFDLGVYLSGSLPVADVLDFYATLEGWTMDENNITPAGVPFYNEAGDLLIANAIEKDGMVDVGLMFLMFTAGGGEMQEVDEVEEETPAKDEEAEEESEEEKHD